MADLAVLGLVGVGVVEAFVHPVDDGMGQRAVGSQERSAAPDDTDAHRFDVGDGMAGGNEPGDGGVEGGDDTVPQVVVGVDRPVGRGDLERAQCLVPFGDDVTGGGKDHHLGALGADVDPDHEPRFGHGAAS